MIQVKPEDEPRRPLSYAAVVSSLLKLFSPAPVNSFYANTLPNNQLISIPPLNVINWTCRRYGFPPADLRVIDVVVLYQ